MNELYNTIEEGKAKGLIIYFSEPFNLVNFTGIVFYYSSFSPSLNNLKIILAKLLEFPSIQLHIFDSESEFYYSFLHLNVGPATGWGDAFWIKNGKTISKIHAVIRTNDTILSVNNYNRALLEQ